MAMEPQRLMRLATVASTSVALTLVGAKAVAWVVTDSVSMLSSLVDTSLDLVGSLVTFFAVRLALTPADADHRFGHGRNGAGWTGTGRLRLQRQPVPCCSLSPSASTRRSRLREEDVGLMISALALVLTIGLVTFQRYVVRRTGSIAIGADMAHYGTDLVATLVTGVGLFLLGAARPAAGRQIRSRASWRSTCCTVRWKVGRDLLDILMDRELPRRIAAASTRLPGRIPV